MVSHRRLQARSPLRLCQNVFNIQYLGFEVYIDVTSQRPLMAKTEQSKEHT